MTNFKEHRFICKDALVFLALASLRRIYIFFSYICVVFPPHVTSLFPKVMVFNQTLALCVIGAGGLGFNSLTGQIGRSCNGSPPLQRFCFVQALSCGDVRIPLLVTRFGVMPRVG